MSKMVHLTNEKSSWLEHREGSIFVLKENLLQKLKVKTIHTPSTLINHICISFSFPFQSFIDIFANICIIVSTVYKQF